MSYPYNMENPSTHMKLILDFEEEYQLNQQKVLKYHKEYMHFYQLKLFFIFYQVLPFLHQVLWFLHQSLNS